MDAPIAPAAPAPPSDLSATQAAANAGDFAAFDAADQAARSGKPLAPVAVEKPATAAEPEAPKLSRKERDQQDANERVRKAVDAATADLRAELARLRTAPRSAQAPPAATAPPEKSTTDYKRLMALPGAPKLADFESVEEHAIAASVFVNQTLHGERVAADRQRTESQQTDTYRTEQVSAFDTRVEALAAADPEIATRIVPMAQQLGTLAQQGGPAQTLSDLILESDVGPQILDHFRTHPESLSTLLTPPAATRGLPTDAAVRVHFKHFTREFQKLEASFTTPPVAAVAAPAPVTTTAAPPPPPSVSARAGTSVDPAATAVARGDFDTFDRMEQEKERRRRGIPA